MARGSNGTLVLVAALGVGGYFLWKSGMLDKLLPSGSIDQLPSGAVDQLPSLPSGSYGAAPSSTGYPSGGSSPASGGYPSTGGQPSGGNYPFGGNYPSSSGVPSGGSTPSEGQAPISAPSSPAPAGGGALGSILKGGRQYCSGDYCYVCLPDGSCATVSGPGITQPIMGQTGAFANSTGIIGKICDSKGNCWECGVRTCVNANLTAGGQPKASGSRPGYSGSGAAPSAKQQDCNALYPQAASEAFKCLGKLGTQAGRDCMNAVLSRWPRFKVCLLGGAPAAQQPAYQQPAQQPAYQQPAYQAPPVSAPAGGVSAAAILDRADTNGDGKIGDSEMEVANRAWTEGRLVPGASSAAQDKAILLITKYWTSGGRF